MSFLLPLLIAAAALHLFFAPSSSARVRQAVYEHLVVITRCGLAIGPGLRALADERLANQSRKARRAADLIRGLASRYEATGSLSAAFEGAPRSFVPAGQLDLLRTAETHGALPHALDVLCDEEADRSDERWRLIEWLAYPVVLALFVIPFTMFQGGILYPRFAEIFDNMDPAMAHGPALPLVAELALALLFVGGLALLVLRQRDRLPLSVAQRLSQAADLLLPRKPFRQRRQGRWLKRAGALLRSGATLPEALDGAAGLRDVGHASLNQAAQQAREGQPLEAVLGTAFGPDASRLLAPTLLSAERCGSLGAGLDASGRREEARAARELQTVAEFLKPAPIALLGILAGAQVHMVFATISNFQGVVVNQL